jgi:hypothetical protein
MQNFVKQLLIFFVVFSLNASLYATWSSPPPTNLIPGLLPTDIFLPTPTIGVDKYGNAIAAWSRSRNPLFSTVEASTYDVITNSWSSPITLTSESAAFINITAPLVAVSSSGNATVSWRITNNSNASTELQAIQYNFNTKTWSPISIVAPGVANTQINTFSLGMDDNNNTIVVWNSVTANVNIIRASISSFGSNTWSAPQQISPVDVNLDATNPVITVQKNGDAVAIWNTALGSQRTVSGAAYKNGVWLSSQNILPLDNRSYSEILITTETQGQALAVFLITSGGNRLIPSYDYDFATNTWGTPSTIFTGSFVTPISFSLSGKNGRSVLTLRLNGVVASNHSAGGAWTPFTMVSSQLNAGTPTVGIDDQGYAVTIWISGRNVQTSNYSPLTLSWGPETTLVSSIPDDFQNPKVATNADGNSAVIWFHVNNSVTAPNDMLAAVANEPISSIITANPSPIIADGISSSTVVVTLLNGFNIPIVGHNVSLSQGGGSSIISPPSGPSDNNGQITFTVRNTVAETVTYTATDAENSIILVDTAQVTFTPNISDASKSTVVANPEIVSARPGFFSTITVTLLNAANNPVPGKVVSLSANGGSSQISAPSGPSDANGRVTFTVSDTVMEDVTYTATNVTDNVVISQTATVSFIIVPPPVNFAGKFVKNRFLNDEDEVIALSWKETSEVAVYKLYQDGVLIQTLQGTTKTTIHNFRKNRTYVYTLVAFNSLGFESNPATTVVKTE